MLQADPQLGCWLDLGLVPLESQRPSARVPLLGTPGPSPVQRADSNTPWMWRGERALQTFGWAKVIESWRCWRGLHFFGIGAFVAPAKATEP